MNETVQQIVDALKTLANEDDMASVQINSDGVCIMRYGLTKSKHLTIEQFCQLMYERSIVVLQTHSQSPRSEHESKTS